MRILWWFQKKEKMQKRRAEMGLKGQAGVEWRSLLYHVDGLDSILHADVEIWIKVGCVHVCAHAR